MAIDASSEKIQKSRFTEEQIATMLNLHRAGVPTSEICRKYGVSSRTFYGWRSRYGGMISSEVRRVKALEDENAKLKRLVANQTIEILALKDVLAKKW